MPSSQPHLHYRMVVCSHTERAETKQHRTWSNLFTMDGVHVKRHTVVFFLRISNGGSHRRRDKFKEAQARDPLDDTVSVAQYMADTLLFGGVHLRVRLVSALTDTRSHSMAAPDKTGHINFLPSRPTGLFPPTAPVAANAVYSASDVFASE